MSSGPPAKAGMPSRRSRSGRGSTRAAPLLKGFLEAAIDEADPKAREYLEVASKHTDRLAHIVTDLLTLSELEDRCTKPDLEDVDLENIVRAVVKIFEQAARAKGLTLEAHVGSDVPPVRADAYKLQQVLVNLVDNAVKYTDAGKVKVSVERRDSTVAVTVADTGIGIPEERRDRIFERFYVVDKSRSRTQGGTGLGLSIVKHIVLLHSWDISVASAPGRGSTFTVTIPIETTRSRQS